MKVSHSADHATHAIIGSASAIDFGISDSPEFFHILSSTLYSDQKLAVIRETICNAWDAHIDAGIPDKAIEITLTQSHLIIRDFGKGIAKKMIGPVYGTYGGSTKKEDGRVTGGFGLGCKAPFAYTDHFEVTSWHENEKTIYALSKSNAEVNGKPSIMPIISLPTDETGLQVKVDIKSQDFFDFQRIIETIVFNGEIKATLNDKPLEVLAFSTMEHNFLITKRNLTRNQNYKIILRYGNVIYPVEEHEDYKAEYRLVCNFLNTLSGSNGYSYRENPWYIVFQAEPNTISVTPSRESLALQGQTITTLKSLMTEFLKVNDKHVKKEAFNLLTISRDTSVSQLKINNYFNPRMIVHHIKEKEQKDILVDFPEFAREYTRNSYPTFDNFHERDIMGRLNDLVRTNFGNKKLIKSYRKLFKITQSVGAYYEQNICHNWFYQHLLYPIYRKMSENSTVHKDKLIIYGKEKGGRHSETKFFRIPKMVKRDCLEYLPFLRNIVIVAFSQMDVLDRADDFPIFKYLGTKDDTLVYIAPRVERRSEAAVEFFKNMGFYVVDLTKVQPWEEQTATDPAKRSVGFAKPRKIGVPMLKSALTNIGSVDKPLMQINTGNFQGVISEIQENRIEEPKAVWQFSARNASASFDPFDNADSHFLIKEFGSDVGITVNVNQTTKYISTGSIPFEVYIWDKVLEYAKSSATLQESLPYLIERFDKFNHYSYKDLKYIFEGLFADPDLVDYFGFKNTLTDRDKSYIRLYNNRLRGYQFKTPSKELNEFIRSFEPSKKLNELIDKTIHSKFIKFVNSAEIKSALQDPNTPTKMREKVRDLLLEAIEG